MLTGPLAISFTKTVSGAESHLQKVMIRAASRGNLIFNYFQALGAFGVNVVEDSVSCTLTQLPKTLLTTAGDFDSSAERCVSS